MFASNLLAARRITVLGALAAAVVLVVLVAGTFALPAIAQERAGLAAATSGVFVGTDANGNFQSALEDAVAQAAAAAGCCDIRISYEVLKTTGQHGGFIFFNDIAVKILAEW